MARFDLTVRGAGIFGLSIAWTAVRRGARVRVIDPAGVASGASGGIVGALQPHVPEAWNQKKAFQLESLLMAEDFWAGVETASGQSSGYGRVGRVQPLADARAVDLARRRETTAKELWPDEVSWSVVEASDVAAWSPPAPTGLYVHDTLSAIVHPRKSCHALAAAIRAAGAVICNEAEDEGPVVWATGWRGLKALGEEMERNIGNGVKGQAALLLHDMRGAPQIFADGLHIVPHLDGTVAIGSTSEREFSSPDQNDEQLDAILARAYEQVPALRGAPVLERWAGVRPRAKSRAPLLGAIPLRDGHFVANGGFKIGFGMAPKIAAVMCDLVLDGKDTVPDEFRL